MKSTRAPSGRLAARLAFTSACVALLLSGCGSDKPGAKGEDDPAMTGALGEQITVDPNMSGGSGPTGLGKPGKADIPAEQRSPEAIQAARDEAMVQAGGTLKSAPQPQTGSASSLVEAAASAARVAQAAKTAKTDCTQKVQYAATWAAKLPEEFPVYPRGAVQETAGTDSDGCHLRVVNYVSPVSPGDVIDFYYTMATSGGYGAEYRLDGSDHVLGGRKGDMAYLVYARKLGSGLTEVDLIASGN